MKNGFRAIVKKINPNWRVLLGLIILDILAIMTIYYIQYPTYQAVIAESIATSKELTATTGIPIDPSYRNIYSTFEPLMYIGIFILWILLAILTGWLSLKSHWVEKKMTGWYQEQPRLAKFFANATLILFFGYSSFFLRPGNTLVFRKTGELIPRMAFVVIEFWETVAFCLFLWLTAFYIFYCRLKWPKKSWVNINP